jgi:hypothetical protein
VELLYAAVEMLFDEQPLDTRAVARIVAAMVAGYRGHLPPVGVPRPKRRARHVSARKRVST